jgi:hypothetical protein
MKRIHNSLKRQLKQHFGGLDSIPKEWQAFVETVNDAYWESDRNRIALEDTLKSTTENLTYASSELHALFQVLPDLFLILDSENVILECQCRTGKIFAESGLTMFLLIRSVMSFVKQFMKSEIQSQ